MKGELFDILVDVNVDCKNIHDKWVNTERLVAISELLKNSNYERINVGKDGNMLSHIYSKEKLSKDKSYVVISSHVDTVFSMTSFHTSKNNGKIKGTFDNSLTNAVAIYNMLENNFADNVIIAFTGDEENMYGHVGAKQTMKFFDKYGINISCYVVLDVTWDMYLGNSATIENVKLKGNKRQQILSVIKDMQNPPKIVSGNFFDDETQTYKKAECFSLCVPVMDSQFMHSNVGCRLEEKMLFEYANVVPIIVNQMAQARTNEKDYEF